MQDWSEELGEAKSLQLKLHGIHHRLLLSRFHLLKCSWMRLRMFMLNLLSTMLIASPLLPNLPVRPIRCRYVSLSGLPSLSTGKSKLITTETCSTSIPAIHKDQIKAVRLKGSRKMHPVLKHDLGLFSQSRALSKVNTALTQCPPPHHKPA